MPIYIGIVASLLPALHFPAHSRSFFLLPAYFSAFEHNFLFCFYASSNDSVLVPIDDRFAFLLPSPEFHQGDDDLAQLLLHALVAEYTVLQLVTPLPPEEELNLVLFRDCSLRKIFLAYGVGCNGSACTSPNLGTHHAPPLQQSQRLRALHRPLKPGASSPWRENHRDRAGASALALHAPQTSGTARHRAHFRMCPRPASTQSQAFRPHVPQPGSPKSEPVQGPTH